MATFIAIVERHASRGYVASFPDFPGCEADGASLDELMVRAKETLAVQIEKRLSANQHIGCPTSADAIERGNALLLAAIDIPDDIDVTRIDLAIPSLSLVRIDALAQRLGLTRGALFVEAVNRWSSSVIERRQVSSEGYEGPTLFDFSNPLELSVEPVGAADQPKLEQADDFEMGPEAGGERESEDITAEVARLFERPQPDQK